MGLSPPVNKEEKISVREEEGRREGGSLVDRVYLCISEDVFWEKMDSLFFLAIHR